MRKAFICPSKYVQGEDELLNLGYFVKTFGDSALLIADSFALSLVKDKLEATQKKYGVKLLSAGEFSGECSRTQVAKLKEFASKNGCSCTIGLGGGKAIDTAKCVAEGSNLIICPTIAATDAPTSHSAVLYTDNHEFDDYAYFRQNPSVVLIDLSVIANAPSRFLVSGMGDALSTYFEARANVNSVSNVNAGLPCGADRAKGTLLGYGTHTAFALATLCYESLISDGAKAKAACDCNAITPAFEKIVETNILLSGLGFESGGLAAAHALHDGLTCVHDIHGCNFHGEVVAFGTICQLILENSPEEELYEVIEFCCSVGLPVCLKDLMTDKKTGKTIRTSLTDDEYKAVAAKTCIPDESIHNMPFPVTEDMVIAAIKTADKLGYEYKYGCDCGCDCK
ncbi:glycerol dehydrogenase [Acidaminococcus sp. CAG:917]|nr:glycerol dehydrogenase [Acidaminococcus sp. CAG:917]